MLEALCVALGVFLLLETSTRVYLFGLAGLEPARINSVHALPQTGFLRRSSVPGLGFELEPEIDGYFKLVPFRTNSRGLRDREYSLEKPEGTFRVAVLGSSFALPAGVAIEDAFHSLLEEQLTRERAPTRFEFLNFAVGMYGPEQILAMLESRALAYAPDLVLLTASRLSLPGWVRDPTEAPRPRKTHFQKSYPILQSFFLRLLRARLEEEEAGPRMHVGFLERLLMKAIERWAPERAGLLGPGGVPPRVRPVDQGSVLDRLARLSSHTGIPVLLVRLELDATERLPMDREVEARARELGLHFLDTRDAFAGRQPAEFWIYQIDAHPNREAHEIFAREIATLLRAGQLLPP